MKVFLSVFLFLFLAGPLPAEVGILSVSSEDQHTKKEDFWHTFEYYAVGPFGKTTKCQATRISKKWFATAAHCVSEVCKDKCTIRIDLLEQPYSIFSSFEHTAKKPVAYPHPQYDPGVPVAHDFALLKLDLNKADTRYYKRGENGEKNRFVTKDEFNAFLKKNASARKEYYRVKHPIFPPLIIFNTDTCRIDRHLSVISIFGGKRKIMQNPNPTDYVKELGFAYTKNFGVVEGMSGSGVMANTGELVGVVAAYLGVDSGGDKNQYFMFAVFDKEMTSFMEDIMGSDYYKLERKEAFPKYVTQSTMDHREVIDGVKALSQPGKKQ